jgi:hypothetical protein
MWACDTEVGGEQGGCLEGFSKALEGVLDIWKLLTCSLT